MSPFATIVNLDSLMHLARAFVKALSCFFPGCSFPCLVKLVASGKLQSFRRPVRRCHGAAPEYVHRTTFSLKSAPRNCRGRLLHMLISEEIHTFDVMDVFISAEIDRSV